MKSYDSYKRNQSITKTLVLVFTATILLFSVIIGMYCTVLHYSSLTYYDDTGAVLPILYRMNQNIVQEQQELRTEAIVQPEYDEGACFMDWDGYIDDMTVTSNVEFLFDWHIHSFGNQTQAKAPFCAEAGEERRNGDTCDYGEACEIKKHDHTYNCVVTPPSCTEQGYTTYSCDCGDSYEDDYTAATGHSYAETIIPPTCEEHGYKLYTCQCGDSYSVFYKNALRHNYGEWVQTEAPTCTEFGEERRWCDRCGGFEVRVMALPTQMVSQFDDTFELYLLNLPNNMVSQEFKASFDQITEIVLSLNIKATSGTITLMIGNSPGDSSVACLDYDIEDLVQDEGWVIFDCLHPISIVPNQVYYLTVGARADQRVTIRGKLFEPGAYTYDRKAFGGWLKDSHTLAYQIRSNLFATGHDYTSVTTAPTCTEQGYTTHTCYCGECYVDSYVDALNHSFGDWHIVEEPTCAELGEEYRDCNRCDHFEIREIATTEHTYEAIVTVPTCTEQGYTTYTCHCGDSYVDSYVDALGHRFGVWEEIKASTCTEPGEEFRDCDRCGHLETCEIAAMGHTYEAIVTVPTCTEQGYTIHTCHCGDSYEDAYVNALDHSFGEWTQTKEPTCIEVGEECRDCDRCDYFETQEIDATGHSHEATVTAPTCTEQGYTTYICRCGDSYVDAYVNVLDHSFGKWTQTKAPTCTADGEERRDCDHCDHFETREIATTEHTYEAIVTVPTCTEQGYTTYTCHCGDSYVDSYVDALGHRFGVWEEIKASTCTEPGEELRDCDRCGHLETCEIAATGHTYEAIVTVPTCTEQGYTTHTCHCGDSYEDAYVNALGHNYGERTQTKAPTCTEGGEERKVCQACDHFEVFELSKIEHVDNDLNGSCDRCGERTRLDEKSSDGCFGVMRFSSCSMLLLLGLCFVVLKRKKD